MRIPLRHARIDIERWSHEREAGQYFAQEVSDFVPVYIGAWHTEERVSSLVATDVEGKVLWIGLMAEDEEDPWIVPTFGGLLFASCANLLLIDSRARIVFQRAEDREWTTVLIGDTVVWVVGWETSFRFSGHTVERFESHGYDGCTAWLEGDRLWIRTEDEEYAVTWEIGGTNPSEPTQ